MVLGDKLVRISKVLSWLVIAIALAIIVGWQFRVPWLKGQMLGTFVAPNTALSFLFAAASVLLQLSKRIFLQRLGLVCAWAVTLFAVATGIEYLFDVDLYIDRFFMAHRLADWSLPGVGRYTINSAVGFCFAGCSLLGLRRKSGLFAEVFAILVLLVSYLSLVALIFGASALYDHVMAVHTAVLFGFLALALLTGIRNPVLVGILTSPFAGAVASRKMIFWIMFLIPFFGGLELWAERTGLVSLRLGTAISTIASVAAFTFLALRIAMVLNETDQKRAEGEAALLKSMQLAAAGRMAASIAHEVNNPLESVTNLIFLLKDNSIPNETRNAYLDIAEREITRVAEIARRTLGFYRDDSKESVLDILEVVDRVLDLYQEKLANGIRVERKVHADARVQAKLGEVRQIVTNLVANAIDAMRSTGGTLTIDAVQEDQFVTLSVSDTGTGIPAENLKRLFEPFFTTKKNTGTGLGLWITKELVMKNGGTIRVQSSMHERDHGTRFDVSLPAAKPTSAQQVSRAEVSS